MRSVTVFFVFRVPTQNLRHKGCSSLGGFKKEKDPQKEKKHGR